MSGLKDGRVVAQKKKSSTLVSVQRLIVGAGSTGLFVLSTHRAHQRKLLETQRKSRVGNGREKDFNESQTNSSELGLQDGASNR